MVTGLVVVLLLTACSHEPADDAVFRAKIIGTWTTANIILPDQARVSDTMTTYQRNGSWLTRYVINRAGTSRQQTTSGAWQIENGFMFESQTNVDGVADLNEKRGSSKIIRLDSHEMVLSNWYSPCRVFLRQP